MNLSAPFIARPVATMMLGLAILLIGAVCYRLLPISPLPQVDFPTIEVSASLPGASPEVMAATVATPLERALGSIAGIRSMSSTSNQGSTRVNVEFELGRDINAAAREVQAAINASRNLLPSGMRSMPSYKKASTAGDPVMAIALSSDELSKGELYDLADTIVGQSLAQVTGVGAINIGGSSLPAVRIELQASLLEHHGLSLDEVRQSIASNNQRRPKGFVEDQHRQWQVQANDQLNEAADYRPMVIRYENGAAIRLGDVARVTDAVENRYNSGFYNDRSAVLLVVYRQSGANILETLEAIQARLPALRELLPASVELEIAAERTRVIRATFAEAKLTLAIAVALVILLVFLFLGSVRRALIPALAVPISLIGSFTVMYLWGFSLNIFSLMALILATGLVVDDAIVVLENIARHIDNGEPPLRAAYLGSQEVGFTLLSMNVSLVVVFLSILFMGGVFGQLFREFSITLATAVLVSLLVSLTLTPMLCARWLRAHGEEHRQSRLQGWSHAVHQRLVDGYDRSLGFVLQHPRITLLALLATIALNVFLFIEVPKTLMPQQDNGQLNGFIRGDDGLSFQVMQPKMETYRQALLKDPAVAGVAGFIGGDGGINNAFLLIRLTPIKERGVSSQQVIERLRDTMPKVPGARLFLMPNQDLSFSGPGRDRSSQYEYQLLADDLGKLRLWQPKVLAAMKALPELVDIDGNEGDGATQVSLNIDRDAARRLGIEMSDITSLLNNAFSQRQISTIYAELNQYQVVMEVDPRYAYDPVVLQRIQVVTEDGRRVPLSTFASYELSVANDRVRHQNQFASESIYYQLAPGVSLEQANAALTRAVAAIGLPSDVQGRQGGTGGAFQSTLDNQPLMILGAIIAVYIVLGILYESYIHPLTIISTLPSAGVGALLTVILVGDQFSLISLLGLFLLIGIVMKNAILMIDLALQFERHDGLSPSESIRRSCLLRLRPILMTTMAAILGALPLLIGGSEGAEMRRPLGLAIIGGLLFSQVLTLYTTPVVYLYLDRLRHRFNRWRGVRTDAALENPL
ncbi:efflux RND transporter permease subunit [Stutzerimonas kirkiae]|uniref:Acriflavine resistance protein B n=1 Tax=Stutzerimonas kirkiae TaxID=2211392 RepID=A0A4V2KD26_9GAMM|nr:efflux RND transporter permease subunit [Stutzerimonas kirkiae]TBU97204.1 acriflavine resistance protein B [Stutzerimonas kirkiae]TBV03626.1 acriflavine resistance protein B [Stutzerimonas kirkiae]TBV11388.1 acriflavine resistance protein B [Stutzerimonas kirkiae]